MNGEGVFRGLATLTNIKRARTYDRSRVERNGDRDKRAAKMVGQLETTVEQLKQELGIR